MGMEIPILARLIHKREIAGLTGQVDMKVEEKRGEATGNSEVSGLQNFSTIEMPLFCFCSSYFIEYLLNAFSEPKSMLDAVGRKMS